jgi:hypothetical protein
MGRMVDLDDLVSSGIVAARLGFRRIQLLHDRMKRDPDCPRPIRYISRTAIWHWPDVREWALNVGWQPWATRPDARRLMLEPTDRVPREMIEARLNLQPRKAGLRAGADGLYLWSDVEEAWHRQINRA